MQMTYWLALLTGEIIVGFIIFLVYVCLVHVYPKLWGQNVPAKMAIYNIFVLTGTVFGPHEESFV